MSEVAPDVWKPKRVNLRGLFTELTKATVKVAVGGATGNWGAAAGAIPDVAAALNNVGTLTEDERAYVLVERAIAGAVVELVGEKRGTFKPKEMGEGIFAKAEAATEWRLAPDFLQRPREVELLPYAQKALEEWLLFQEMPPAQARTASERLPVYFGLHLHEELTEHAEYFAPLLKMLKGDAAPIAQEYWAWERYRAELMREPFRPLFDETFGLSAVFVPLRSKWIEKARENRHEEPKEHEVVLENALLDWWTNGKQEDSLRVLSGDPGSGKSSCAKMWAAQMAERHPGMRVVFVPLHDFGYKGDLRESLKTFLLNKKRITADLLDPLSHDNTLLFFDGLDELAMQGRFSREAAVAFVQELTTLLSNLNRDRRRVLVVLGGRQLVVTDCENVLRRRPQQVLILEAYSDAERTLWWQKYGAASGKGYSDGVPTELRRPDLKNLTEQPLFNYLLALSYGREASEKRPKLDFTQHVTVNAIYEDLMESVYDRVWGDGGNVHLRGLISPDEFEELLEEIGVAVWHSDSRSATVETLSQRCEAADLSDALQKLKSEPDAGVFRLLTAFHFRFTEGRESSVEFTHKSFGEYFAARRIVRLIQTICEQRELRKKKKGFGWDTTQALVQWAKLCGPQALDATDTNLFHLLTDEVRARPETERDAWRTVLTEMIDEMTTQGMPMEQCGLSSYKEMDMQARNAEIALMGFLYTCLSPGLPRRLLKRSPFAAPYVGRCRTTHWETVSFSSQWRFAYAVVSALHYSGWSLAYSDLRGADLRGAILSGANLSGANLSGANLTKAYLTEANLTWAVLNRANLREAYLRGGDLRWANLREADLREADLRGGDLWGADLTKADLTKAANWQNARNISLKSIIPELRPEGWKAYFHADGTRMTEAERKERSAT